jgi:hypothetical protein
MGWRPLETALAGVRALLRRHADMRMMVCLVLVVFVVGLFLAGCGKKVTSEQRNTPPPAGPKSYEAPPPGAAPGPGAKQPTPPPAGGK